MKPLLTKVVSAHVMGGCGMAGGQREAGRDRPDGVHWQIDNLSVHDGSIFPTSIGANPQLSIYGITNRLAQAPGQAPGRAGCDTCLMPSHSALARLQQATTLSLVGRSRWAGWPGIGRSCARRWRWRLPAAIALGHSLLLAVEFVALRFVGRGDPAPQPDLGRTGCGPGWAKPVCAPRVFCWRQPFRWRRVPDRSDAAPAAAPRRGVVLIHGFVCNRGFWTPWLARLRAARHPFIAVNLEPVFGSIDEYVPTIEDAVRRVTAATGQPPVLVCHSMGGLAARAWLRATAARPECITSSPSASPHHGTWLARFSHLKNGRQMRLRSEWLAATAPAHAGQRRPMRDSRAGTPTATTSSFRRPPPPWPAPTTAWFAAWPTSTWPFIPRSMDEIAGQDHGDALR